ncbi:MAG: hypothetical protein LBB82_08275 [Treponema sp.]|jgi:hypothetical protein|nr:hypothetical protein [Treponema sp.]
MPCKTAPSTGSLPEHEAALVEEALAWLDAEHRQEAELVRRRFDCLVSFSASLSLFPSIREHQFPGISRNARQLVTALADMAPYSYLLHVPARIHAMRSFLVTKFHTFSFLSKTLPESAGFFERIRSVVYTTLFTIMSEDVYFSCLDEPSFPSGIKARLADDLISLWDSGTELALVKHFPALEALWKARNESPPSFGTMDGNSEILRISIDQDEAWRDFLTANDTDEETRRALEEFLFGLTYEELLAVRQRLYRFGIHAVDFNEIRSYLGSRPKYPVMMTSDPRAIYDFYMERKEAARMRKREKRRGPHKTLEEIYLKYRMG